MMKPLLTLIAAATLLTINAAAQPYDTNNEVVSTFAGSGFTGYLDGQGAQTMFNNPTAIVADTGNNLYVWDSGNYRIRRITADGTVSTFVGGGSQYEGYGTNVSLSNYTLGSMFVDHSNRIWIVATYFTTYLLSISSAGYVSIENAAVADLGTSSGVCFDSSNTLYYSGGRKIYRYNTLTGVSEVFAGNGNNSSQDGNGIFSSFSSPGRMVADGADSIYVMDGSLLRKIDQGRNVSTIGTPSLGNPLFVDNNGNIIFANNYGSGGSYNFLSKLTVTTNAFILAGINGFSAGYYTNGPGYLARFGGPSSACAAQGMIFVCDTYNQRIRNITFNPQPQPVSAGSLLLNTYPGLTISGNVGRTYQIQASSDLAAWSTVATVVLNSNPYFWLDQNAVNGRRYYRASMLP